MRADVYRLLWLQLTPEEIHSSLRVKSQSDRAQSFDLGPTASSNTLWYSCQMGQDEPFIIQKLAQAFRTSFRLNEATS